MDSLAIVIVAYAVTISLALIFARKCFYEVDSNQELLALGLSNGFGSVTQCMPISASLSRTLLRYNAGGKTQLAAVVSSSLLLIVIVWIAPLFEALPRCILASIIVVALTEMLLKVRLVKKYWLLSRWEGIIWSVTFLVTFIFHISGGLIAGVLTSLLVMGLQCYTPNNAILGVIPSTDLYLDIDKYKTARELAGIKIFRSSGVLNFSVIQSYKKALFKKTGLDPHREFIRMVREHRDLQEDFLQLNFVVLDFSNITFIDRNAVEFLATLSRDYSRVNIELVIGGCSEPIYSTIARVYRVEKRENDLIIFPTLHDAVLYAETSSNKNK
ncbi:unnamed protein product [Phyllotreta striolata]|uniref:STAS domain-containing protein n=1 Tax=Phyllotreta striolata TaxID=444603 RepID=A0A9N9TTB5_PHYSR|nr:unnamed protein product [Phyllotreta striolata]